MQPTESRAREIAQWRSFDEDDPEIPGFSRFYSADPRFPVSIAWPRREGFFYDFNHAHSLHLDATGSSVMAFCVDRADLRHPAVARNFGYAMGFTSDVLAGRADMFWLMERIFAYRKGNRNLFDVEDYRVTTDRHQFARVGAGGFTAPQVTWRTRGGDPGGTWVFFASRQDPLILWRVIWSARGGYDAGVFAQVLASFRWLDKGFFQSIGVR